VLRLESAGASSNPPVVAVITGVLLAAGSGRRYGMPKALVDTGDGPWVLRSLAAMRGCDGLLVVVGDRADEVAALLPDEVLVAVNPDHAAGMGSSLRAGLRQVPDGADAALVMLVDLPDVGAAVIDRVLGLARAAADLPDLLCRASYAGAPGHPVVLGRRHLAAVVDSAAGDRGARDYLADREVQLVECGDLAVGADVDRPR
jgi:CTP:molybdopterin cytidylyltransferase MocA